MHIGSRSISTTLSAVTALLVFGCSQNGVRNALAPASTSAINTRANSNETRIDLPFDPANFVGGVQNTWFPVIPGTIWTYRQETSEGVEINTVEVTKNTKQILGVTTTVVHDQVFLNGSLKENTFDWYANDKDGNVWYFGEDTNEQGSTTGSWEAGKNGAKAGIIMLAHPMVGDTYYQENAPGVVADQARVKSIDDNVTVPLATYTGCVKTQEWTPIEPGVRAFKDYAPGVGTVLENPNNNEGLVQLISLTTPK
jgi:hypothetical protein